MPCDYTKYPDNWHSEIRPRILARAGNRCEWCGLENGAVGARTQDGSFLPMHGVSYAEAKQMEQDDPGDAEPEQRIIKIVLTIAHHPDPDPQNCADDNLVALCQRCHNRLDAPMRAANRKHKRLEQSGQTRMVFPDLRRS